MKALRKIGIQQIEDIALGASLLGAGGGGDPYIGKLMAIGAVRECGEVTLISPEEVPDDALIMPIAMMGAPTVLCEKGIGGTEYKRIFEMVERYFIRQSRRCDHLLAYLGRDHARDGLSGIQGPQVA